MEKKLGFGCMRLPMNGADVNYNEFNKMIDYYIEQGFNYFDTAHGYLGGKIVLNVENAKKYAHNI